MDSKKANTRNRFIYWHVIKFLYFTVFFLYLEIQKFLMKLFFHRQTTSDAIELSEASLDVNLSSSNLRCKVAAGTPPLNSLTFYERLSTQELVILAATVSSVHRLVFPHPEALEKKVILFKSNTWSVFVINNICFFSLHLEQLIVLQLPYFMIQVL